MESTDAIDMFSALAQTSRLQMFRRLVAAGTGGLSAGAVADAIGVPQNTASSHLAVLARAGLIQSRKQSRSVIYSARVEALGEIMDFLMLDCCGGRPELCDPLISRLSTPAEICC